MSTMFSGCFSCSRHFQPLIQQKCSKAMRARKIAQLEGQRNSRMILLVHRQEMIRFLDFPLVRYIDINDSEEVLRAIHLTDDDMPLDIVLHTPGGLVLASLQIAYPLREHKGKVTAFVPHYAMSGGTLIALAADEIVMCKHSVLGPVDQQLGNRRRHPDELRSARATCLQQKAPAGFRRRLLRVAES